MSLSVVILHKVVGVEKHNIRSLASVANNLQEFVDFQMGETIQIKPNKIGSYKLTRAFAQLQRVVGGTFPNVSGRVGITSAQLDTPKDTIHIRDGCAMVSDWKWDGEQDGYDESSRWLYTIFQAAVTLVRSNSCSNPRCICNINETFSVDALLSANICEDCKNIILRSYDLGFLGSIEKGLGAIQTALAFGYSLRQLAVIPKNELEFPNSPTYEIHINEKSLRRWLVQKGYVDGSITQPFAELPLKLYLSAVSVSTGNKPRWCDYLQDVVIKSRQVDTLLYLTKKRHRDHSRHQFYVAALGWFLLEAKLSGSKSILDRAVEVFRNKYSCGALGEKSVKASVLQAWTVGALLHDSAYPLSHIFETISNLCHQGMDESSVDLSLLKSIIDKSQIFASIWRDWLENLESSIKSGKLGSVISYDKLSRSLLRVISEQLKRSFELLKVARGKGYMPAIYRKILKTAEEDPTVTFDHGLWSAANLSALLVSSNILDNMPQGDSLALLEAIEAIGLHNIRTSKLKIPIEFDNNPLACFLRFCDEIQEWNRGTLVGGKFVEELDHIILSPAKEMAGNTYLAKELNIRFDFPQEDKLPADWDHNKLMQTKKELKALKLPLSLSFEIRLPCS